MNTDLEIIRAIEQKIGLTLKRVTDEIDHNADAYSADAGGHVTRLYLRNHELQRVPQAVSSLSHLRTFSIWNQHKGDEEFITRFLRL